jgi:hypothetical protein
LREEDKEERRGLGEGVSFLDWKFLQEVKEGGGGKLGEQIILETLTGHCCCWEFWARGPGNRKDSWS